MLKNNIRRIMGKMSMNELSNKSGLAFSTTRSIVNSSDLSTTSMYSMLRLSKALGVEVEELYDYISIQVYKGSNSEMPILEQIGIGANDKEVIKIMKDDFTKTQRDFDIVRQLAGEIDKSKEKFSYYTFSIDEKTGDRYSEIGAKYEQDINNEINFNQIIVREENGGYIMSYNESENRVYTSVKEIKDELHTYDEELTYTTDFVIEDNCIVEYFGKNKDIVIPKEVEKINKGVFKGKGIKSVVLNEGLKFIDVEAFKDNGITKLVIPSTIVSIHEEAFANNGLEEVKFPETAKNKMGIVLVPTSFKNNKIKKVEINCKAIYYNSFDPEVIVNGETQKKKDRDLDMLL